ncbi:MAG TPA: hypothetical protein VF220_02985 [Nitrososphaeraceae archaeon]
MPKKRYFEKNLSNVNIRTKDFEALKKIQNKHEPFYGVVQRVVNAVTSDHLDLMEENNVLRETVITWQKRALDAESKLNCVQRQLV